MHIPQLCLALAKVLLKTHSFLTANEIQLTLDLTSCIIYELMRSPSSRASTPSTPFAATPSKTGQSTTSFFSEDSNSHAGKLAESADSSAKVDSSSPPSLEKMVYDVINVYLEFFSAFVNDRVLLQESSEGSQSRHSKGVLTSFSKACQLLVLLATFGMEKEGPTVDFQGEW